MTHEDAQELLVLLRAMMLIGGAGLVFVLGGLLIISHDLHKIWLELKRQ